MKTNTTKITLAAILSATFFVVAKALSQTNDAPVTMPQSQMEVNIVSAMMRQVVNNPSSLLVIGFLCVLAWLADDTPFISSRYVAHITVVLGASTYWMFAGPASVPKSFPYAVPVLISNGMICGFIAFVVHRQVIYRLIQFIRSRGPDTPGKDQP